MAQDTEVASTAVGLKESVAAVHAQSRLCRRSRIFTGAKGIYYYGTQRTEDP